MIFIILYDGITGSTNLLSSLNKNPELTCILGNPIGSDRNVTVEYFENNFFIRDMNPNEKYVYKFRYTGYPYINGVVEHVCNKYDNFIILTRNDKISHVMSHEIKQRTNQANIRLEEERQDPEPFKIDINHFDKVLNEKIKCTNYVLDNTKNKNRIVVDYDVLFTDNTLNSIQKFCGVKTMRLVGDYRKVNSVERYKRLITNYYDIMEYYGKLYTA